MLTRDGREPSHEVALKQGRRLLNPPLIMLSLGASRRPQFAHGKTYMRASLRHPFITPHSVALETMIYQSLN